jgi:7-hydroxymethyl chlorophyll a reductase
MHRFMQDYQVHVKHSDGAYETVPYFCLPAGQLKDVIAPSCYACFDYVNALADITVGYMGVPSEEGVPMTAHKQYITVRNARGAAMLDAVRPVLQTAPTASGGDRVPFVLETVLADDRATLGANQAPAPLWLGKALARVLTAIGPTGLEFARYSIDYHTVRNALYTARTFPAAQAAAHVPPYAVKIVDAYDKGGAIRSRIALKHVAAGEEAQAQQPGAGAIVAAAAALLAAAAAAWLALHA